MKKHILSVIIFYALLFIYKVNAQTEPKNLHASQLKNGMHIYINQVPSSAMIHVDFLCRAGYGAQDNANAGFLELYSKLFLSTAQSEEVFNYVPVSYKSNADRVLYSCDVTAELFESYVKAFSKCLTQPYFSEEDIVQNYESMKKRISTYQNSDAGFINSAIESKVSPQTPWKQSFGINSDTFSSYSLEQVKSILLSIQKSYYTPDNCALFITGNIEWSSLKKIAQKYFSSWNGRYTGSQYRTQNQKNNQDGEEKVLNEYINVQKKYVLTSPDFSSDITQIAVQFTDLTKNECQIINEIFNSDGSPYKYLIPKEPALAVRGKEYLSSACTSEASGARLILQAVMEEPYSIIKDKNPKKVTPADQADLFVQIIKEACRSDQKLYAQAQNSLYKTFLAQSGANQKLLPLMEDFWTANPYIMPENLYKSMMNEGKDLKDLSMDTIISHATNAQPFVFIMTNDETYDSNRQSFIDKGFELITKKDDAWYKNNSYSISNEEVKEEEPSTDELFSDSSYAKYYVDNIRTISSVKLKNGIPITTKTIKDSQTVLTSISIAGGEIQSPKNHKKLRTLLVNTSAERINAELTKLRSEGIFTGKVKILSWTTETHSYITLECQKNELNDVLTAAINALIYAELEPLTIDLLIGDQKYQWRRQSASLSFQLRSKAMEYLYKGTPYESVYNIKQDTEILSNTSFQTVLLSYTQLLDASLYSIVFTGDIDVNTARQHAESTFGMLKQQKTRSPVKIPIPRKEASVLSVQLQHNYTSPFSAESAPKESPLLVPTQQFKDPMQLYFPSPSSESQREMFNSVLFEMAKLMQEDLGEEYQCSTEGATAIVQVGKIEASGLLKKSSFINAYTNARKKLISELSDESTSNLRKASMRNTWSYKTLINTQTNDGTARLIQNSILSGAAHLYLESFLFVSNARNTDFISIVNSYFPETPPLQVFSSDSQE
ncbi:MAG: insulinase family protein [Treponema sp.]|nr:insulinase family protein [Treponema sp.]